jgi:hypothetical protein
VEPIEELKFVRQFRYLGGQRFILKGSAVIATSGASQLSAD